MKKSKENIFRLNLLINTSGTNAVKKLLMKHFSSNVDLLIESVKKPSIKRKLEKCKLKGILTKNQWNALYPNKDKIKIEKLDLTLLVTLIQKLTIYDVPYNGWDKWPLATDRSISAKLVQLKLLKEQYVNVTELSDEEFQIKWSLIKKLLLSLNYSEHAINNLETCCLDGGGMFNYYWYHFSNTTGIHLRQSLVIIALLVTIGLVLTTKWLELSSIDDINMLVHSVLNI